MTVEELRESLMAAPKNGFARITAEDRVEMEALHGFHGPMQD